MGSKQYGVDHLNMEINKFTVERKVYHRLDTVYIAVSTTVCLHNYICTCTHAQLQKVLQSKFACKQNQTIK